jgi:hypothetical protein
MPVPRIALDTLAASPVLWLAAVAVPRLFPGRLLHEAALWAAWEGAFPEADRLFEAAARCYQAELDVVPLARLRAHQAMARARTSPREGPDSQRCLDVERRLCRLERIQAPWPPFPLVDATSLLASWHEREPAHAKDDSEASEVASLDAAA